MVSIRSADPKLTDAVMTISKRSSVELSVPIGGWETGLAWIRISQRENQGSVPF